MYEEYWQLERKPFEPSGEQRFYYPSETHQGALLKLRYAIENHRGAALLAGASGSGKTMLVGAIRRGLAEGFTPFVHLVFPQMSGNELLAYLADELGAPAGDSTVGSVDKSVRRIDRFLADNTAAGRHAVVVVDEAHLLAGTDALETLRLLLNFEIASRPGLTLLLAGQPSLLPALQRMPSLDDRLGVKTLLRRFTVEETISYVNHRLTAAGATRAIFETPALEALHELSRGIARQINRLADLALLIGYAEELPAISAEHVESVSNELVTVAPE